MKKILVLILLSSICAIACTSLKKPSKNSAAQTHPYTPARPIKFSLSAFHTSDSESLFYLEIPSTSLLPNPQNTDTIPTALLFIKFTLFDISDGKNPIPVDSLSTTLSLKLSKTKPIHTFNTPITTLPGHTYTLNISLANPPQRHIIHDALFIDKRTEFSNQNFLLSNLNNIPIQDNFLSANNIFRITYLRKNIDSLYVQYSKQEHPLAKLPNNPMPLNLPDFQPDTTFAIKYNPSANLILPNEGSYFFSIDLNQPEGILISNFGENYPRDNRASTLVKPLAYLLPENEFNDLILGDTIPKLAIDKFWLGATGSSEDARSGLRVFYTRMYYANQFFTDHAEGYKSDRGMIFVLYGVPDKIDKDYLGETWSYLVPNKNDLIFRFEKLDSPFNNNTYRLVRNSGRPNYLNQVLAHWRKGKIFNPSAIE